MWWCTLLMLILQVIWTDTGKNRSKKSTLIECKTNCVEPYRTELISYSHDELIAVRRGMNGNVKE